MAETLGSMDLHETAEFERFRIGGAISRPPSMMNDPKNATPISAVGTNQDRAKDRKSAKLLARLAKLQAENIQLDTQISECEKKIDNFRSGGASPGARKGSKGVPVVKTVTDVKRKLKVHAQVLQQVTEKCMAMQAFLNMVKKHNAEVSQSETKPFGGDWKVVQQPLRVKQMPLLRVHSWTGEAASRNTFQSQSKGAQVFLQVLQGRQLHQTMDGIGPVAAKSEPGVAGLLSTRSALNALHD